MPVIAPQHTWKDADHTPLDDWPADCYVQWGGRGVVFGKAGTYATAFFEASTWVTSAPARAATSEARPV